MAEDAINPPPSGQVLRYRRVLPGFPPGSEIYQLLNDWSLLAKRVFLYFYALIAGLTILRVSYDHEIAEISAVLGGIVIACRIVYFFFETGRGYGIAWDAPVLRVIIACLTITSAAVLWNQSIPHLREGRLDDSFWILFAVWVWGLCYAVRPTVFYEGFAFSLRLLFTFGLLFMVLGIISLASTPEFPLLPELKAAPLLSELEYGAGIFFSLCGMISLAVAVGAALLARIKKFVAWQYPKWWLAHIMRTEDRRARGVLERWRLVIGAFICTPLVLGMIISAIFGRNWEIDTYFWAGSLALIIAAPLAAGLVLYCTRHRGKRLANQE